MKNETTELDRLKCNSIYTTLLSMHRNKSVLGVPASTYIREFWDTERCDRVSNLTPQREQLRTRINHSDPDRLARMLTFNETKQDEDIAMQAVYHYSSQHTHCLQNSLTFSSVLWYHMESFYPRFWVNFRRILSSAGTARGE